MSSPATIYCPKCGNSTPAIAFCGHCGGPLPRAEDDTAKTQFGLPTFDLMNAAEEAKTQASMPAQVQPPPTAPMGMMAPVVAAPAPAPAPEPATLNDVPPAPAARTPAPIYDVHAPQAAAALGQLAGWREPEKLMRLLGVAAVVLFVTRFIPIMVARGTMWTWTGDGESVFRMLVFPILVAAGYAFVAFAPPNLRANLPAGLLRGLPFLLSYLGTALLYASAPMSAQMSGGGIVAWFYPALLIGLFALAADRQDPIARGLVAVGGLMTFIGGMIGVSFLFRFTGMPALWIVHNIFFFLLLLAALGSVALTLPTQWWPQVDSLAKHGGLLATALLVWPLLSGLLFAMAVPGVSKLTVLLHTWSLAFGLLFVLWLTAPAALSSLRKLTTPRAA